MRNFFTLDGVPSTNFNTYLASSTMFDAPERDVESIEIPGRNGDLLYDNGRFRNFGASVYCFVPSDMRTYVGALRNWLMSARGYQRYEDSIHPDEYRLVRYTGAFALGESDRVGAAVTLGFNCKPQRFLKSGENFLSVSSGSVLFNPTRFTALPLIRANGNGILTIGSKTITISGNSGVIYLDCDLQDAYNGSTNKNRFVTPDFPQLDPGDNPVTISGLADVEIMPRWWTI